MKGIRLLPLWSARRPNSRGQPTPSFAPRSCACESTARSTTRQLARLCISIDIPPVRLRSSQCWLEVARSEECGGVCWTCRLKSRRRTRPDGFQPYLFKQVCQAVHAPIFSNTGITHGLRAVALAVCVPGPRLTALLCRPCSRCTATVDMTLRPCAP